MPGAGGPMEPLRREPSLLQSIRRQTDRHRAGHGPACDAFPSAPWTVALVTTLARIAPRGRALEIGCGLGLTAIALAWGMPTGRIETIERNPRHADIARRNLARARVGGRVRVVEGRAEDVLPRLRRPYDVVLEDAAYAVTPSYYDDLVRLTRRGGLLLWENWFPLGPDHPYVTETEVRATTRWARRAMDDPRLSTAIVHGFGISVRR
ncbi:MAG: O-methyltransferase [Methanobacteriota archaeon]